METLTRRRHDRLDLLAIAVVTLLCALWGLQQVAAKVAIAGGLPPLLQCALRHAVAAVLLCLYVAWRQGGAGLGVMFRRDGGLRPCLVVGTLFALEFVALFPGLALTSASRGVIFLYTAPFFTALGVHLLVPAERFGARQAIGLGVAFSGVAVAFADGLFNGGGSVVGDLLCLLAGALWGITTVVLRSSPGMMRVPATRVLMYQLGLSAPLLVACSLLVGEHTAWAEVTTLAWLSLFYQTVIVAFASYLAWMWLVLVYPAGALAGFSFLTPLFGILAGVLLLGEHAGPALLVGLVAIAAGLMLLNGKRPAG
jgi:drug/metabolite transporter (DMT)-like permease